MSVWLMTGDCREQMKILPDECVDSVVTDPPYELGFMGKSWDGTGVANDVKVWAECLRVLKPGGHLLAFSGTRTQHRMVCAIEDAGFEIRDQAGWMYGSGFPKSLDVSKAIDKAAGAERAFEPVGNAVKRMIPGADQDATGSWIKDNGREYQPGVSAPATAAARQWQGWGTALKPAWEPICMARKPLIGTVAANVLKHGTGALNIDASRVEHANDDDLAASHAKNPGRTDTVTSGVYGADRPQQRVNDEGRWPANLLHDGSPEVVALFPQTGVSTGGRTANISKTSAIYGGGKGLGQDIDPADVRGDPGYGDSGSAARFFYCAKASKKDRGEGNTHPTVKPTELMRYLCRLVTPPGGTVLDPFAGSGSTLKAAQLEGFDSIGIEMDEAYATIIRSRLLPESSEFTAEDAA